MGITTLVGKFDGTTPGAVMVDAGTRVPFGPVFEGEDASEQIEAFVDWMGSQRYMAHCDAIGLSHDDIPNPLRYGQSDPREWASRGLRKLVAYWKREYWDRAAAERAVEVT